MSYGEWVIRYRWWIIVATLGLVMSVASGARFLGFTTDYRVFFSKENPQLEAFEALQNTYTKEDNAMIAIEPKDGKVFTRETLKIVEEVTKQSWQIPYSIRVDSVTNFQYTSADGDDLVVQDLVENAEAFSDADLEKAKRIALAEPLLRDRLINPDTSMTAVNVTINLPAKSITEVPEVVTFVRGMADDVRAKYPDVNVYLTGVMFMNNSFSEAGPGRHADVDPDHVPAGHRDHAGGAAFGHGDADDGIGDRVFDHDRDGFCGLDGHQADSCFRQRADDHPDAGGGGQHPHPDHAAARDAAGKIEAGGHHRSAAHQPPTGVDHQRDHRHRFF